MKDVEKLVSIIVPVYNAQNVIERCLNSLIYQTYNRIEIIVIDDGSNDQSYSICKKMEHIDKRIKVYRIKNSGVSKARNYGLEICQGKWITFVDADDALDRNAIEKAMSYQEKYMCDTVCWNFRFIKNGERSDSEAFISQDMLFRDDKVIQLAQGLYTDSESKRLNGFFRASWGKIFCADIIRNNNIKFPDGIKIGEDALFLIEYFMHCKKVYVCSDILYSYYVSEGSVVGRYKKNFFEYQINEFNLMSKIMDKYLLEKEKSSIWFWHKAEKEFIENELKNSNTNWNKIKIIKEYLRRNPVSYYLALYDGNGFKSKVRSIMIKKKLYFLTSIIDTYIIWKRF